LITHKLREIMAATDNVSVMRRGEMVATLPTAGTSPAELAELMVGRKVLLRVNKTEAKPGPVVLRAEGLGVTDGQGVARLRDVSFELRAGEILGVAGVAGNGQSELLEALAGTLPATGRLMLDGAALRLDSHDNAAGRRAAGLAHVPEDRQRQGLIMEFHAWENIGFGYQSDPAWCGMLGLMDNAALRADTRSKMSRFDVRPPEPGLHARSFSGGNQQKLVLAREIERAPRVLLVGQPTRGVDIGAIEFIHQRIVALRDAGAAILLVSVELEEILSLSDRVIVMFDGRISGERITAETDERDLGMLMAGMGSQSGEAA
ncbi:MAG: ATP-binding cassette domain-containing protein, partial [Rhodobacteraceae bacterium]|nr:ATP-binding cassette domain-containing protein [Paracoccaceae bacterium]